MLKRFVPEDLGSSLRSNAFGIAVFVAGCVSFVLASLFVLRALESKFAVMSSSSWASPAHDEPKTPYVSGQRYDLSEHGVAIPPSRDERAAVSDGQNAEQGAAYYRRDCYEKPNKLEESDLCAQWANAAAVRFGNRIALESFWLNSWIGFLTALGVFLASIGVVFAGMASLQASRGLAMMSYGFMPSLSFSVQKIKKGWIRMTVRNAGTGPASDVRITVDGKRVPMRQDRFGAGAHATVECEVETDVIKITGVCLDLSKKRCMFGQSFVLSDSEWVLNEEQPENA